MYRVTGVKDHSVRIRTRKTYRQAVVARNNLEAQGYSTKIEELRKRDVPYGFPSGELNNQLNHM